MKQYKIIQYLKSSNPESCYFIYSMRSNSILSKDGVIEAPFGFVIGVIMNYFKSSRTDTVNESHWIVYPLQMLSYYEDVDKFKIILKFDNKEDILNFIRKNPELIL